MNVNFIAEEIKAVTDCKNPKGYILCKCGMSAIKKPKNHKKDIIYICSFCERKQM